MRRGTFRPCGARTRQHYLWQLVRGMLFHSPIPQILGLVCGTPEPLTLLLATCEVHSCCHIILRSWGLCVALFPSILRRPYVLISPLACEVRSCCRSSSDPGVGVLHCNFCPYPPTATSATCARYALSFTRPPDLGAGVWHSRTSQHHLRQLCDVLSSSFSVPRSCSRV